MMFGVWQMLLLLAKLFEKNKAQFVSDAVKLRFAVKCIAKNEQDIADLYLVRNRTLVLLLARRPTC